MKTCTKCGEVKPLAEFHVRRASRDGLAPKCKPCNGRHVAEWKRAHPERVNANNKASRARTDQAAYWRERRYGLSPEAYLHLLDEQANACAICGEAADLVVDHCHDTLEVRGLLCRRCNLGLGYFLDDPSRLDAAQKYLRR